MKIIELTIDDYSGVEAISFVECPAIEEDFLFFSKDKDKYVFAKIDVEKRIVTGPCLIPEKMIYRYNQLTGEEYNVFFSKETVEQIMQKYLIEQRNSMVTLEHEEDVEDITLIESWIVLNSENDKSNELGYNVPNGTAMVSYKVNNDEVWNKIKTGEIKGFSIEGYFINNVISLSETEKVENLENIDDETLRKIIDLLNELD